MLAGAEHGAITSMVLCVVNGIIRELDQVLRLFGRLRDSGNTYA